MSKVNTPYLEALYRALHSERGIVVRTNDPEKLKQRLYAARRAAKDEELAKLSFATSRTNPERDLLIVKKPDASE